MLSVVATAGQQNRNVLELLTACCRARLDGSAAPSLLPTEAELAAAWLANSARRRLVQEPKSGQTPSLGGAVFWPNFKGIWEFPGERGGKLLVILTIDGIFTVVLLRPVLRHVAGVNDIWRLSQ